MKHEKFENMQVWQDARKFAGRIYRVTAVIAKDDHDFDLVRQLRRAAVSIALNIAEGHERKTNKDFAHFLSNAKGSAGECRAALYLALDLNYISESEFNELQEEVTKITRQLSGFGNYLVKTARQ